MSQEDRLPAAVTKVLQTVHRVDGPLTDYDGVWLHIDNHRLTLCDGTSLEAIRRMR